MQSPLNTLKTSRFQQAIEAIEALSFDDREILLDLLKKRLHEQRCAQMSQEIAEIQQEYREGNATIRTVDDFLMALDSECS